MCGCEEGPAFLRIAHNKAHHGHGVELHADIGGSKLAGAKPEPAHKRLLPVSGASRLLSNVTQQGLRVLRKFHVSTASTCCTGGTGDSERAPHSHLSPHFPSIYYSNHYLVCTDVKYLLRKLGYFKQTVY